MCPWFESRSGSHKVLKSRLNFSTQLVRRSHRSLSEKENEGRRPARPRVIGSRRCRNSNIASPAFYPQPFLSCRLSRRLSLAHQCKYRTSHGVGSRALAGVPMSTSLAQAADAIPLRLRSLAERPSGVLVRTLIDRFMAQYAGRDHTLGTSLNAWSVLIGDFPLENVDNELIHAARAELADLPALAYKGVDHEGKKIFKAKRGQRTKSPATLNRYMASLGTLFTWAIDQRLTPRKWARTSYRRHRRSK